MLGLVCPRSLSSSHVSPLPLRRASWVKLIARGSQRAGGVNLGGERTQHTHSLILQAFWAAPWILTTHTRPHVPGQG